MTVPRATLHNEEDINRKNIREGDDVIVQRAGDVIPQIVGPAGAHRRGTKPFRMPTHCPLCGTEIVRLEAGHAPLPEPRLSLARARDPQQLGDGRRRHRGGRRAARAQALGSRARALPARPLPADEGAAARARRVPGEERDERDQLDRGLEVDSVRRVLFGLNIPDVGFVTAQNLVRHFGSVDRLLARGDHGGDGIGPDRAESIAEWFADDENRRLVEELRALGLRFEAGEEDRPPEGPLTGQTYVITGTLEGMSREQAQAEPEARGAKVTNSVSKKTTGLIVGEEPGAC